MSIILKYFFIYLVIISGSLFLSGIFKKKTSQTIPTALMSIIILLYVLGIIGLLKEGVWIISIIYILLGITTIIFKFKKHNLKEFLKENFSTAMIIFTILFVIFACTTYNKIFTAADDFNYWSMAVKNMYYLDDFITNENAIIRTVYPPAPTLLQYSFEKIIGENRHGIELFASMILGFSLFLPFIKNVKKRRKFSSACILGLIIFIPAIFVDSWFYGMIYVDTLLGLLVGYILFEYYTSTKDIFSIYSISIALAVISLIKPTGFFIAIITVGILVLDYLINTIKAMKEENKKIREIIKSIFKIKNIKIFIIFFLICIITFASWEIYKSFSPTAPGTFESAEQDYEDSMLKYFVKVILKSIAGTDSSNPDIISNINIFNHLFGSTPYSNIPIKLPAGTWFAIFIIGSIVVYKFVIKDSTNKKFIIFMISVFIGTFIYICLTQAIYILRFPNFEAVSHASIERYVGSYLVVQLFVIIGIVIDYLNKKDNYLPSAYAMILSIILIFTPIQPIANLTIVSGPVNTGIKEEISYIINMADSIKELIGEDARVYGFDQNSNINENITKFKYYIYPISIMKSARIDEVEDIENQKQQWINNLYQNYDYVVILDTNDYLKENYGSLFKNQEVYARTLYKIEKFEDLSIQLEPIYKQEVKAY